MQTTIHHANNRSAVLVSSSTRRLTMLSLFTLCATLIRLGAAWDVQWHVVVGRDSFWIPPHLLIYSSVACCGLLAAAYVLLEGFLQRGVRSWPLGMFVGGIGVVVMLLAAPFDDLWHRWYGIDVTIWSPPHMLGVLGAWVIAWGALATWAQEWSLAAPGRGRRCYQLGFGLTGALLVCHGNFGLIPAVRWSFINPHSPFLYAILGSLVLPAVALAALSSTGRWWAPLLLVAGLLMLRLVEQGVLELGYRVVIGSWGEQLRGRPELIYTNYNLGTLLGATVLLALALLARLRPALLAGPGGVWAGGAIMGAVAGLLLWLATLLIHSAWPQGNSLANRGEWAAEAGLLIALFGGAGPLIALPLAPALGALSGSLGAAMLKKTSN